MKKKLLLASVLSLCALGLAACGGAETSSSEETPSSTTSSSADDSSISSEDSSIVDESSPDESSEEPSSSADTYSLSVTYSGTAEAGQSITLISTLYINGTQRAIADQENVTYTPADEASAELVSISGFTAYLQAAGDCTLNASYTYNDVVVSTEYTFTIAEGDVDDTPYTSIAEVKSIADANGTGTTSTELYRIRGKVMNTSGSSAYIADETAGIYIYNWYFSSTDTACSSYNWQVGTYVDIKGVVQNYYGVAEMKNYGYDGTYANLYNGDEFDVVAATELTEEADLQTLLALEGNYSGQIGYNGNPYNITCQYVEGSIDTSTTSYIAFRIGETELELRTDGSYDDWGSDLKAEFEALELNEGDTVKISNVPLYEIYKGSVQFHYFGHGTTIEVLDRAIADSVSVSLESSTIAVAGSTQASATVSPDTVSQKVIWSSSNEEVATVDENGVVTGIAAGEATITATSKITSTVSDSATITVVAADDESVAPTAISVSEEAITIGSTDTYQASATITPSYAAQTVSWASDNTDVATVDANGLISAVALGTANITATSTIDSTLSATIAVEVSNYSKATITFDSSFNSDYTYIGTDRFEKTVGDVVVEQTKGSSNIALTDGLLSYIDPLRCYKGSITSFTLPEGATYVSAEITDSTSYSNAFNSTNVSTDSAGATIGDYEVTFDENASNVLALTALNQFRMSSITITYSPAE